ncbi:MAG: Eco57I restriction-modification methylase domain-containing protein [Mycolicibacterium fortuitum]|uniref:Eco57I restriction-modification methylase domain-containing protein n=1 Tax=Mycobacteroides abscessus TaxID=36809 RepID=UPI0009A56507|nr:Eco57I restriction-modification methylase domain-containing protein [Mycobacteroides abscessus]SKK93066.1 type III restriction system endonuclease, putative [Mycobacteroides abscessus subsp. massiliense]
MTDQAVFSLRNRNPDVLTCIANLSNDEVSTPPELANRMLDRVAEAWADANKGANIWADKSLKFLDPFTKSGVFLREITARLTHGLRDEIADIQERVDHILTKQVFGIGITALTTLIARRSVYCSKSADGKHSVAKSFATDAGNIWFEPLKHTWSGATEFIETADDEGNPIRKGVNGKCTYCGASQVAFDRDEGLETHAYAFIHTDDITARIAELFGDNMQFDVIIGNPPYQLDDGGYGNSAAPIYDKFVDQAKKLNPRLLSMVIPARWFAGGKGLDDFRESMLKDDRVRSIDDYLNASDVFPGVGLKGGICYFLWDRDNPGPCRVTTNFKDDAPSTVVRPLLEEGADVFIRFNEGLSILKKVVAVETGQTDSLALPDGKRFEQLVSSRKPFGLDTTFKGTETKRSGDVLIYQNGGTGYTPRTSISNGSNLVDKWKVFVGYAAPGTGNRDTYPHRIISTPFVGEPGSISSETYLCIGPFDSKEQAENALSYLACRLTRLLVLLHKPSQHVTRKVYTFVPTQDWTQRWTDDALYEKYAITDDEIAFIEKVVRPMDLNDE